jgi:hypothetical protein
MSATSSKARVAWLDRFRAPAAEDLLAPFNKQTSALLEHARRKLLAVDGIREELCWHGIWNWSFVFRLLGDGERAWAYLIPDPARPRIAIPIDDEIIPDLPVRKLSKFIRDGLTHAPVVDGVRWSCWDIQNRTQVEDIVSLAQHKLKLANAQG